jgi:outer membrane protein assembly factor BamB
VLSHSFLKSLLVLTSLLLVTACSTITELQTSVSERIFGREAADPPEPLSEIKETVSTKLLWKANIGEAGNYEFSPVIDAGFAYAASAEGEVVKLDANNGQQSWRIKTGEALSGGVGVGGSLVLVGTRQGDIYASDLNGK